MIRIRVSSLAGFSASAIALTACAAPSGDDVATTNDSALTVMDPGSGVFAVAWTYGTPTGYSFTLTQSTTDEYVRAGETMTFSLPAFFLWQSLYPNDAMPNDVARLEQLQAKLNVVFVKGGAPFATASAKTTSTWHGSQPWDLTVDTTSFHVDKHAEGIRFELTITDATDASKTVTLAQTAFLEVPVIGGAIPNKTLLFDTLGSSLRQRVLEGGQPVSGANLAVAYTDWRAATLIDESKIDRTIGTATEHGRFGAFDMPILGDVVYDISFGSGIDDAWSPEQALLADASSRLMPPYGRTAYEGSLAIPAGAKHVDLYFHVRAYVVADYSKWSDVKWKKYGDGERVLVAEK
ncbi:MAG TPA: hypothetical protein VIF62_24635, partial [Labilithrix sp.]